MDFCNSAPVCRSQDLGPGELVVVPAVLPGTIGGSEVVVIRRHDGVLKAFLNQCAHVALTLDAGTRRFWNDDRTRLKCRHHGAEYRIDDGVCTSGPCVGLRLDPVLVEETKGWVSIF